MGKMVDKSGAIAFENTTLDAWLKRPTGLRNDIKQLIPKS